MVRGKVQKLLDSLPTTKTTSKFHPEGTVVPEGTLTIPLKPGVYMVPDELLRQRVSLGETQVLVRWKQVKGDDTKGEESENDSGGHYLKWMRRHEVVACCPHLLRSEKMEQVEAQRQETECESAVDIVDEEELKDMQHDVSELVKRARRQMRKGSPAASLLANTIHVLSAYARNGTLASAFRESGALDLLLDLVWSKVANVRQSAGQMLKALASHDSGSRAYVLLSLTRTENDSPTDVENRTTLMELFAETASKEEHGFSFDNISLPQVSGRVLFSLMKKYLRVTSLLDELEQLALSSGDVVSSQTTSLQFELMCAASQLIMDLSEAMGWNKPVVSDEVSVGENKQPALLGSIFSPSSLPDIDIQMPSKTNRKRRDFTSREAYGEYVKATLEAGMRVVMLEDYESVSAGDIGEFRRCNDGTPPAQFRWEDYGSTYWVHWEMVEILDQGNGESSSEVKEPVIALKTSRLPYGFMASKMSSSHSDSKSVSQAEWWEVLAALRRLPPVDQDHFCHRIEELTGLRGCQRLDDIISVDVSLENVQTLLTEVRNSPSCHLLPLKLHLEETHRFAMLQGDKKEEKKGEETVTASDETSEVEEQEDLVAGDGDDGIVEKLNSISDETKAKELREALDLYSNRPFVLCKALDGLYSWVECNSKSQVATSEGDSVLESVVGVMANMRNVQQLCETACQVLRAFGNKGDEIRINAATNGAIKTVLLAMHTQCKSVKMQMSGLEALKDLLGASTKPDVDYKSSESTSLLREIVATIAAPAGSYGGLPTLPSSLRLVVAHTANQKKPDQRLKNAICWGLACLHVLVSPSSMEPSCLVSHLVACGTVDVVRVCLSNQKENVIVQQLGLQILCHLSMAPVDSRPLAAKESFPSPIKQELHLSVVSTVISVLSSLADKCDAVLLVCNVLMELMVKGKDSQGFLRKLFVEKGLLKTLILTLDKHKGTEDITKKGFQIVQSLSESCEEQVCATASDGAIGWVLAAMQSHAGDQMIAEIGCLMLELMTRDLDNAIVMAANNAKAILTTAIDKHSGKKFQDVARQLLSRMEGLDERAALHERILQSVLGGTIQLCLSRIDEARNSQTPLSMLHVDQLIRQLCIDSDVVTPSDGHCWEKIEVSSNNYRKNRLTDGDKHSYWESSGSSGTHWIRLHMLKGIVVRKLTMLVNPSDSSYMPQKLIVSGGPSSDSLTELKEHIISSSVHSVTLLENVKKHYSIIQIKIRRCQQGGIDTRIRGILCEGPRASYWPLFRDSFTARTLLYYHILTKTWASQNISALDLFDRFSNAVWHEQEFADQFLPTQESRVALGNACRAALVTPLLTAVTATDQSNSGSIAHLITSYVSHVADQHSVYADLEDESDLSFIEPSKLMEVSHTRRMCRLLVDCDHGPVSEIDDGQSHSGGGLHLMSECWRSLVHQRVERFLSSHSSHRPNPLDVSHSLCNLYRQLTQTMNDLFGGHSRFAVALNEGLSGAFKSLSEVSGVEVCETLALAIDAMLDVAGKDSGRFQYLAEGERERRLRELAQPLHCLRDLDLAHVFEHFYRRHLCRRLLRGRSVSVDLERKAAHEYDACFRLKWPIKMLEDMMESDNLMKWFVDHQMELLDVALTQSTRSQDEIWLLSRKLSLYRHQHLTVHTLTPCHWPLKSRPLPYHSSLPVPLSRFCEDYERFFIRQSCSSLRQYERVRKLKWTLYGWAVIRFSHINLVAGTPHMIILNVFNSHKEITFSKLKDLTGLSDDEVRTCLVALTANRQKILLQHRDEPAGSGTDSDAEEAAYADGDIFSVNEGYLQSVKAGVTTIRIRTVHLVGAFGEDSEGRRNLAHVFERRKAIIDAAIVRLLKKEKLMATDGIALQVMKGCQEGQFEGHKPFGSFECHYQDVCLAIGRLTSNGYLKRDEENSNVLHYVPDSSLLGTQTDDITESSATEEAVTTDGPCEATASAVGFSKSAGDEKKKKSSGKRLPRQKSSMDSKHAPASPGLSRGRASKKSPAFIRMYSCDVYAHDPSPVSLPHTSATLSSDQVKDELMSMCNRVAQVLKLNLLTVQHLLCHCKWNEDATIHRFLSEGDTFLVEAGLEVEKPFQSDGDPSLVETGLEVEKPLTLTSATIPTSCPVCDGEMLDGMCLSLACNHGICKSCWKHHLSYQIQLSQSLSCTCPVPHCTARPDPLFIQQALGDGSAELEKFQQAVLRSYVEGSGKLTWCRNPQGCDQILLHGGVADVGTCSNCGWTSCFSCTFTEAHYPASCQQISQWVDDGGFYEGMNEEAMSKQLAKMISKKCPRCSAPIEKNEGCLHMTCKCGHDFCWRCLKPWRPTHSDYYHCSAKVSKAAKSGKRFVDINQQCAGHHTARLFAERLSLRVSSIMESVPVQFVTFVVDACRLLQRARKVLSYSCVYLYYAKDSGRADYLSFIAEALEGDTNALQAMLENTVLRVPDIGHAVRTIQEQQIASGQQLMARLQVIIDKILLGSRQHYQLGEGLKEVPQSGVTEPTEQGDSATALFGHLGDAVDSSDTSGSLSGSGSSRPSSTSYSESEDEQSQDEDEDDDEDDDEDEDDDDMDDDNFFDEDEEEEATDVYSDYDDSDYDL